MMLKNHFIFMILFITCILTVTGCTVEQKKQMGANSNLDEGFSGYGTLRARDLEGPLTDMSIPDETVKGRTKIADDIADEKPYIVKEPNLGFKGSKDGANIYSGRVGLVNDKHTASNHPHLARKKKILEFKGGTIEEQIRHRLENLETISHVYVVSDDGYLLVGVESSEQDRSKLLREVQKEIKKITPLDNVRVALDIPNIKRIKKLQNSK